MEIGCRGPSGPSLGNPPKGVNAKAPPPAGVHSGAAFPPKAMALDRSKGITYHGERNPGEVGAGLLLALGGHAEHDSASLCGGEGGLGRLQLAMVCFLRGFR